MRLRSFLLLAALTIMPMAATATAAQPPAGDFVPMDESAPGEQIPALPLIATAYGFIWVGVLVYVWSIGRRLQKVESELADLEARGK